MFRSFTHATVGFVAMLAFGFQLSPNVAKSEEDVAAAALSEAPSSTIGFPTVDAALGALRSKVGVEFTDQGGWTVVNDPTEQSIWSFPPSDHPAHPAAVKRQIVEQAGGISIEMNVLCGSTKSACDDLVREFEQLNAQIRESMGRQQ